MGNSSITWRLSWILGALSASSYAGCNGQTFDSRATGGQSEDGLLGGRASGSGGQYELGGSTSMGGKITLPLGSGGGPGSGGGSAGVGGRTEGTLAVCELPGGPSVGNPSESLVLDDFEDGDSSFEANGLRGSWYGYHDEAPGTQVPTGDEMNPEQGGPSGDGYALHVTGTGFDEWGSGIAAPLAYADGSQCLFDASAYQGVTFWAKGTIEDDPEFVGEAYDPGRLRLLAIEKDVVPSTDGGNCYAEEGSCWDSHRFLFELGPCWTQYTFRFEDLIPGGYGFPGGALDLDELYNLNFEIGRGNRYDIWIDDFSFFVGQGGNGNEG
jgi:hypothetical protein